MSRKPSRRKCRCCKKFFFPDYRNTTRQKFCSAPACRQASKAASQRRWLHKPGNHDGFHSSNRREKIQAWRQAHPGYWRKQNPSSQGTQAALNKQVNPEQGSCAVPASDLRTLQDLCPIQPSEFIGLISMLTGSTLQEDIEATRRRLLLRGRNILGIKFPETNEPNRNITAQTL
jgi:hypothetical protein